MDEERAMLSEETVAAGPGAPASAPADGAAGPVEAAPDSGAADTPAQGDSTDPDAGGSEPSAEQAGPVAHRSLDGGDASLLALVDRLTVLLQRSDLAELEVESGSTSVILRKASAIQPSTVLAAAGTGGDAVSGGATASGGATSAPIADGPHPAHTVTPVERKPVVAPLTGIFYGAPSPGSAPYVKVGSEVAVGQVIGLIEAMKLFNEIKSDVAGRVAHIAAENGQLIKAKQPIIEVEPL